MRLFFAALFFLSFFACQKAPTKTKAEVMQERLDNRVRRWYVGMEKNCLKKVVDEATIIVDSTLLADAKFKRDTSDMPEVPGRPERPEFVPPEDTMPVQPLLNDSINQ